MGHEGTEVARVLGRRTASKKLLFLRHHGRPPSVLINVRVGGHGSKQMEDPSGSLLASSAAVYDELDNFSETI